MESISSKIIAQEAENMWYTVNIIFDDSDIFTVKKNWQKRLFKNIDCWANNSLWVKFANYKSLTYLMLWKHWIKIPKSIIAKKWEQKKKIMRSIQEIWLSFPLVVKPSKWAHWDWVSVNITNEKDLNKAIDRALKFYHHIVIQEFLVGEDHRLIVIDYKFVAAMKRIPAHIIGNGIQSIQDLITQENKNPLRGKWHSSSLTKIKIDKELKSYLSNQWFTLESIPGKNKMISIRKNANLSTWWISMDITDDIHPEIIKMVEKASKILWLKICWIDYLSNNINKPLSYQKWWIIEVNHTPWLRWHHFPTIGKPRNVAKAILQLAFKK